MKHVFRFFGILAVFSGLAYGQLHITVMRDENYNIIDWDILAASNNISAGTGAAYTSSNNTFTGYNVFTSSNLFSQLSVTNATLYGELEFDGYSQLGFGGGVKIQNSPEGFYIFYQDPITFFDVSKMQVSTNAASTALLGEWLYTGPSSSGVQIMTYQAMTNWFNGSSDAALKSVYNVFTTSNRFENGTDYVQLLGQNTEPSDSLMIGDNGDVYFELGVDSAAIGPYGAYFYNGNSGYNTYIAGDTFAIYASGPILFGGDIVPLSSNAHDLGSASAPLAEVHATDGYFSSGTLNVGDVSIKSEGNAILIGADTIANAGINWTTQTTPTVNDAWFNVAYGNGLFVAVGAFSGTRVATSPDGINWTARSVNGDNDNWLGITYGNGLFVMVAAAPGSRIATSPDGINWTIRSGAGDDDDWKSVTYGNDTFVAVGYSWNLADDVVMTSPDGINWTARTAAGDDDDWYGVTYGDGLFVAVALSGNAEIMTSTNGITWTTRTGTGSGSWRSVAYGNGKFVAVGLSGGIITSDDGITWSTATSPEVATWYDVAYGDGVFVIVGPKGVLTSVDGDTWTFQEDFDNTATVEAVAHGDGMFVAVSSYATTGPKITTSGKKLNNTALDSKQILGVRDVIPAASNAYSLGSAKLPFAEIHATEAFIAQSTLHIGGVPIRSDGTSIIAKVANTNDEEYATEDYVDTKVSDYVDTKVVGLVVTNSIIDINSVTNRMIFIDGLLKSWTTNGVPIQ